MKKLFEVAKHEFKVTAMNKAFLIITLIGPFLILAITVLPGLMSANPTVLSGKSTIAIVTEDTDLIKEINKNIQGSQIEAVKSLDQEKEKQAILSGEISALVVLTENWTHDTTITLYSKTETEAILYSNIEQALGIIAVERKMKENNIDPVLFNTINTRPSIVVSQLGKVDKPADESNFIVLLMTGLTFAMMIYMTVLLYGQMIGRSVVQEKLSKTVEIMLSSVSAKDLMFGKIIGLGAAGLLQYAFWILLSLTLTSIVGPAFNIAIPASLGGTHLVWLIIFFILGFFLYSTLYAAIGAAAEDEQHLTQLAWPFLLFLMIPLVFITPIIMNANSTIAITLSYIPFSSPIVMLLRVLLGNISIWEPILACVLLIITIVISGIASAKIFRVGILMTGKRFKINELIKWLFVK